MKYEAQRCLPAQHLKILWFPTGGDGFQAQAGVSYKCKASRALKIGSKTLAGGFSFRFSLPCHKQMCFRHSGVHSLCLQRWACCSLASLWAWPHRAPCTLLLPPARCTADFSPGYLSHTAWLCCPTHLRGLGLMWGLDDSMFDFPLADSLPLIGIPLLTFICGKRDSMLARDYSHELRRL